MQCFKFIQNRSRLTALNLSKTAQHATFRIFFTLCSTYSPRFELFRFLTARKSANQIIACCFNSVLPKKKNLLLWIRFNSWKFRPQRFKPQMLPAVSTSHKSHSAQIPTCLRSQFSNN